MPTAPTLNRPPRLPDSAPASPPASGFASPPSPRQTPTGGAQPDLMRAAVATSVRGNPAAASLAGSPAGKPPPVTYGNTVNTKTATGSGTGRPAAAPAPPPPKRIISGSDVGPGGVPSSPASAPAASPSNPTVQSPGAPPGVPDTSFTIPLLPQDEAAIQSAQAGYASDVGLAGYNAGQAAYALGDPTQMARWGVGTINPNSALALAALKAQQEQEAATNLRARQDTLFSGLAVEDRNRIAATQQRADLLANDKYQNALAKFNQAMIDARNKRDTLIGTAQADERAAALKNLPTPNTASGGFPSSTATGSKSIASKGGKGPSTKTSKPPKPGSTKVPSVGKPGKTSGKVSGKVTKPPEVKITKPPKVAGKKK